MKKKFTFENGKTYHPNELRKAPDNDVILGKGCKAEKIGDQYCLKIQAARHGGGVDTFEILESEFLLLQSGGLSFEELMQKYDS